MKRINLNKKDISIPDNADVHYLLENYTELSDSDPFFIKKNGKIFNSIVDEIDAAISDGDVIEIFELVLGG